jgi:hypothetical protein
MGTFSNSFAAVRTKGAGEYEGDRGGPPGAPNWEPKEGVWGEGGMAEWTGSYWKLGGVEAIVKTALSPSSGATEEEGKCEINAGLESKFTLRQALAPLGNVLLF